MLETTVDEIPVEDELDEEGAAVNYDIATYPSDYTLGGIYDLVKANTIYIPKFQRNFVWSIKQSSLLIDSFLRGLPVPQIFLYIDDEKKYSVIDGQQRILTIVNFIDGYFGEEDAKGKREVFRLRGLGDKSPYEGKVFDDLGETLTREFKGRVLRAINIRQLSPDDNNSSMFYIFERLNTGGTALKPQEIRNCVHRGEFVKILKELNKDANWREIIGTTKLNKHQRDIEFILRIFSLSMIPYENYEKPMKEYLNKIIGSERNGKSDAVSSFRDIFPATTKFIIEQLGEKPFHVRGPLNTSVMDSVFSVLINKKDRIPEDIEDRYKKLNQNDDFVAATRVSTSDVVVVKKRFDLANQYLADA